MTNTYNALKRIKNETYVNWRRKFARKSVSTHRSILVNIDSLTAQERHKFDLERESLQLRTQKEISDLQANLQRLQTVGSSTRAPFSLDEFD